MGRQLSLPHAAQVSPSSHAMYFSSPIRAFDRLPGSLVTAMPLILSLSPTVLLAVMAMLMWQAGAPEGVTDPTKLTTWL